jgi:hypothetical protein
MSRAFGRGIAVGLLALMAGWCTAGAADVSVDEGGAILMYPKVLNAGGRDTLIQMTNSGNTLLHVHCYYTDARLQNPSLPASPQNRPIWQSVNFFLWLTRQQPTAWTVSRGRSLNPSDGSLGIDPGSVPAVSSGFTGELTCVEVDSSGNPIGANRLHGEATLMNGTGDASKYAAVAIQAGPLAGGGGTTLELDNEHYGSCPNTLILNHFAQGANSPVVGPPDDFGTCGSGCGITTELTLVPCGRNYENRFPGQSQVSLSIINEFEERFSASTPVECWLNARLDSISGALAAAVLGTLTAQTRLTPVPGSGGVIGVAEETHTNSSSVLSRAAWNLPTLGSFYEPGAQRTTVDAIVISGQ